MERGSAGRAGVSPFLGIPLAAPIPQLRDRRRTPRFRRVGSGRSRPLCAALPVPGLSAAAEPSSVPKGQKPEPGLAMKEPKRTKSWELQPGRPRAGVREGESAAVWERAAAPGGGERRGRGRPGHAWVGAAPWAPQDAPCRRGGRPHRAGPLLRLGGRRFGGGGIPPGGHRRDGMNGEHRHSAGWSGGRSLAPQLRLCSPERRAGTPVPRAAGRLPLCQRPAKRWEIPVFPHPFPGQPPAAASGRLGRGGPSLLSRRRPRNECSAAPLEPPLRRPAPRTAPCAGLAHPGRTRAPWAEPQGSALAAPLGGDGAAVPLPCSVGAGSNWGPGSRVPASRIVINGTVWIVFEKATLKQILKFIWFIANFTSQHVVTRCCGPAASGRSGGDGGPPLTEGCVCGGTKPQPVLL